MPSKQYQPRRRKPKPSDEPVAIVSHCASLPANLESSSSDCGYGRLYPEAIKPYERPIVYPSPPKPTYDLPRSPYVESAKFPMEHHHSRGYDFTGSKLYGEAAAAKASEFNVAKYTESSAAKAAYELPKYSDQVAKSYVGPQYCHNPDVYPVAQDDSQYQGQTVPHHSIYPYISPPMTQPPYYMGPR